MTPIAINLNDPQFGIVGSIHPGSPSGADLNGATSGVYTPPAGMNGVETVTFIVENGCHQTFQGHLAIDVNHSPVGGSVTTELPRGAPPLVLTANDLASDDESLSIVSLSDNHPSWVTLVPGSSGSPGSFDNATIQADPPPGTAAGTYTMSATVQDLGGLKAVATIKLIIRNLAPTAVADAYGTDQANFTFDPTKNDVDPEGGPLCLQTVAVTGGAGADIISPNPNKPAAWLQHERARATRTRADDLQLLHHRRRRPDRHIDDHHHLQQRSHRGRRQRNHRRSAVGRCRDDGHRTRR
jgi:hypothetical protein